LFNLFCSYNWIINCQFVLRAQFEIESTFMSFWLLALQAHLITALAVNQDVGFAIAVDALLHYRRPASNFKC
jgi:hypothetical protein